MSFLENLGANVARSPLLGGGLAGAAIGAIPGVERAMLPGGPMGNPAVALSMPTLPAQPSTPTGIFTPDHSGNYSIHESAPMDRNVARL